MLPLSQARHLGGLHRASPVPFRGSYFTSGLHPPDATPQRLIACLYRLWRFPLISSPRFVAHSMTSLLLPAAWWIVRVTPSHGEQAFRRGPFVALLDRKRESAQGAMQAVTVKELEPRAPHARLGALVCQVFCIPDNVTTRLHRCPQSCNCRIAKTDSPRRVEKYVSACPGSRRLLEVPSPRSAPCLAIATEHLYSVALCMQQPLSTMLLAGASTSRRGSATRSSAPPWGTTRPCAPFAASCIRGMFGIRVKSSQKT